VNRDVVVCVRGLGCRPALVRVPARELRRAELGFVCHGTVRAFGRSFEVCGKLGRWQLLAPMVDVVVAGSTQNG
jgi:hypothetical protein